MGERATCCTAGRRRRERAMGRGGATCSTAASRSGCARRSPNVQHEDRSFAAPGHVRHPTVRRSDCQTVRLSDLQTTGTTSLLAPALPPKAQANQAGEKPLDLPCTRWRRSPFPVYVVCFSAFRVRRSAFELPAPLCVFASEHALSLGEGCSLSPSESSPPSPTRYELSITQKREP